MLLKVVPESSVIVYNIYNTNNMTNVKEIDQTHENNIKPFINNILPFSECSGV